jgi:acetyl esterase/lipase
MRTSSLVTTLFLLVGNASGEEPASLKKTAYTYKTVGELPIRLDVHRPSDESVRPVVVWIHGGALIMGNRDSVPSRILDLARREGYAVVSIDYRLAPEVKLPDIAADLDDAFAWIRGEGAKTCHLDPERVVVTGGSAGGYLTLLAGVRLKLKPRALVAYWGYGDVDGDWYTKPSEHYRKSVPLIAKAEAESSVGKRVFTGGEAGYDGKPRSHYYLYLRQNGLWTKEVTGFDPATERTKLDPYCPVRNVTKDYPPTMLVHGTEDTDVPYELSVALAKEFEKHKVPHELVTVRGAGHGLSGGDPKLVEEASAKALAFIREHLNARSPKR